MAEDPTYDDVPDADRAEQSREVEPGLDAPTPPADPEVPDADAAEQSQAAERSGRRLDVPADAADVPEADALEQSMELPPDDDVAPDEEG